jgi:hypothetical protein
MGLPWKKAEIMNRGTELELMLTRFMINDTICSRGDNVLFFHTTLKNSVARVRERNIPIERPPLVGEVSANFF